MLEWFDTRIFSMFLSITILLLIMVVMKKLYLPESKPLTLEDVKVIEEIKKITHYSQPAVEKPPAAARTTVRPRKRIVKKQIQNKLSELRKKQPVNKVSRKKVFDRTTTKIGMKKAAVGPMEQENRIRQKKKITLDGLLAKSDTREMKTRGPVIAVAEGPESDHLIEDDDSIRDGIDTRAGGGPGSEVTGGDDIPTVPISQGTASYGDGGDDISAILQPLVEWMKRNPAEFTPVEKKFLEYGAGDLTSRAHFNLDNKTFDLLLLIKQANMELRISLREGTSVILLIDLGLQERSNYLREGLATTGTDGRIVAFGTSQKSASEEATEYFYQVFMSWWNWVQNK